MKINSLNPTQISNFLYWVKEHHNHRNMDDQPNPMMQLAYAEHVLLPEFLKKYPDGILTGWS